LQTLASLETNPSHIFSRTDILDRDALDALLSRHRPRVVIHCAAETHVDRSIRDPKAFVTTNVVGTLTLLEATLGYWQTLDSEAQANFRFLHVSTDEVYGSLRPQDAACSETTPYAPNSPYSASKAGADHLVRAYYQTYGFPAIITNCSNNYGPYQFPEKLMPLMITRALSGQSLPLYGDGQHVRDWLFVSDHCAALRRVIDAGRPGEAYNIGGWNEKTNLEVVYGICDHLDVHHPKALGSYREQIAFVKDRPGHDRRYAIDASKMSRELGWRPVETFDTGLCRTVDWYLTHTAWVQSVVSGDYRDWVKMHYASTE
jgi:dTDP-glucose 4,6-dehydratase